MLVDLGPDLEGCGHAHEIDDVAVKNGVVQATAGRQGAHDFEALFRCDLLYVLHTKWQDWGTAKTWPTHSKWRA